MSAAGVVRSSSDSVEVLGLRESPTGRPGPAAQPAARLGRRAADRQQSSTAIRTAARSPACSMQDLRADAAALADQAQQQVLGADVVVVQLQRLAQRQLEHLLGPRGERDVPAWASCSPVPTGPGPPRGCLERSCPKPLEDLRGEPVAARRAARAAGARCRCSCGRSPRASSWASTTTCRARFGESLKHGTSRAPRLVPRQYHAINRVVCGLIAESEALAAVDWDDRLDDWEPSSS